MARKTKVVTIDAGRDAGKSYLLTEMPASQSEAWATRALLALLHSGIEIPEEVQGMGLAGIASVGLSALGGIPWELLDPLLREMMECVQFVGDLSQINVATGLPHARRLVEDDIEDMKTRLTLRKAVLELHVDFFTDGSLLMLARDLVATNRPDSSGPRTSRRKSRR